MILSNRRAARNQIFFGLFLALSLITFYFFLYETDNIRAYPYLSISCLSGIFLIGPMIYFLAQYSLDKNFSLTFRDSIHLIPPIFALFTGIVCVKVFGQEDIPIYYNFFENRLILILGFLGDASFSIYLFLAAKKLIIKYLWNLHTLKNEPIALASMLIFDIFILAAITEILSLVTGIYFFFQLSILLVSICVIILFILNLIYPNFEKAIGDVVTKEKERRSYLSSINSEELKQVLNNLLQKEEIFTDESLSLKKLAALARVSTHQLSEFINIHYNKNYSIFINEFRIEKAQKLLLEKPEFTILAIAYDVGFKSKSSFNEAFLKISGITPSQFKKNHQ